MTKVDLRLFRANENNNWDSFICSNNHSYNHCSDDLIIDTFIDPIVAMTFIASRIIIAPANHCSDDISEDM